MPVDSEALVERLYCVAAAYLMPKLEYELGRSAAETRKRLKQISQTATGLAELLIQPDFELEVPLDFVCLAAVNQTPAAV